MSGQSILRETGEKRRRAPRRINSNHDPDDYYYEPEDIGPRFRGRDGEERSIIYIVLMVLFWALIAAIAIWAFVKTWQNAAKGRTNMMNIMTLNSTIMGDYVEAPYNATDGAIARFDGATGELLQNSVVILDDNGRLLGVGGLVTTVETVSGSGAGKDAIDLDVMTTYLDTSGGTSDLTLAVGVEGQVKIISMIVAGNAAVLDTTDGNLVSTIATITFDAIGESVQLLYTSAGWTVTGVYGATIA